MEFTEGDKNGIPVVETPPVSDDEILRLVQQNHVDSLRQVLLTQHDNNLVNRIKDWSGDGLLAIACWHGSDEAVKMLLGCGAEIDAVNNNKSTPLHRACYRNNAHIAQVLLAFGARFDIKDKSGRTAAEVGDSTIKRLIQSHRIDQDIDKVQQLMELGHEIDDSGLHEEVRLMAAMERARRRQQQAVPIILYGASNSRLVGTYEPVDEISNEWPVYSLRGDRDLWLTLVGDEWLVQHTKDRGTDKKALIRMSCIPHCWPELRTDGINGIVEYHDVLGIYVPVSAKTKICIVTEAEAGGMRASSMFKLAEEEGESAALTATDNLPPLDGSTDPDTHDRKPRRRSSSSGRLSFSLVNHDPVEERLAAELERDSKQPAPFSIPY